MAERTTTFEPVLIDGYVPLLDISAARRGEPDAREAVARAIDRACRESGFFLISGHGIDQAVIDAALGASEDFFALPQHEKERVRAEARDVTLRGLRFSHAQAGARNGEVRPSDLCELFTMNRLGEPGGAETADLGDAYELWSKPNVWPADPPGFRAAWLALYAELESLSLDLMRLFALALHLPETYFDGFVDEHVTNLCANYYMPLLDPPPGAYRKGPHADAGTMTILYQDDEGGLEVIHRRGDWVPVPAVRGTFVVNIGRLMEIWTNDRWVATQHRLLVPPQERWANHRISLPFFHHPNWSAIIECLPSCRADDDPPRHEPVHSGEYLTLGVGYLVAGDPPPADA
jgi:isopenicillin N synthase-like dioxygenase